MAEPTQKQILQDLAIQLAKLETTLIGPDGQNGMRGDLKRTMLTVDEIKQQTLQHSERLNVVERLQSSCPDSDAVDLAIQESLKERHKADEAFSGLRKQLRVAWMTAAATLLGAILAAVIGASL